MDPQAAGSAVLSVISSLASTSPELETEDIAAAAVLTATTSLAARKRSASLSTPSLLSDGPMTVANLVPPEVAPPSPASHEKEKEKENRLMTRAINEGDFEEVRQLLASGCDPNAVFVKLSMLQYATLHEDVEMMQVAQLLLSYKADPCYVSSDGICALHIAVSSCYLECTKLLVKRGANVEYAPKDRCPPLFVAIMAGDRDAIGVLLEAGADPNRTVVGKTPLMIAVEAAKDAPPRAMEALLKQLVTAGARLDAESENAGTVLHFAASQNSAAAVHALIALGADPNARGPDGITPLETALRYHHADAALALLAGGADPNIFKDPLQPLLHSCLECKRSTELVSAMLAYGADARLMHGRNPGLSTLEFAILRGSPETVSALLKYFPVQTTIAAAIFALRVEHSQSTKELQDACLQIGEHLATAGYSFRRAPSVVLQWASRAGKEEFLHALLKAGLSPDSMDPFGRTPLHWACSSGHIGVVRLLLKVGANPNAGKLQGPLRDDA